MKKSMYIIAMGIIFGLSAIYGLFTDMPARYVSGLIGLLFIVMILGTVHKKDDQPVLEIEGKKEGSKIFDKTGLESQLIDIVDRLGKLENLEIEKQNQPENIAIELEQPKRKRGRPRKEKV